MVISRQDRNLMRKIIRSLAGESRPLFIEEDDGCFCIYTGGPTDEGYDYTTYTLYSQPVNGEWFRFSIDNRSRDCDGRLDHYQEGLVKLRSKASRVYFGDWSKGYRRNGRFNSNFLAYADTNSRQRDYSAEAMGY